MSKISPKFPIEILSESTALASYEEEDIVSAIRFNLKNIILTNPGERIMNANFGAGILKMLFDNATTDVESRMRIAILNQVRQYAPYAVIEDLKISYDGENSLTVAITYNVPELDVNDYFDITTSV
jgi:phage baseplate assembly protein W